MTSAAARTSGARSARPRRSSVARAAMESAPSDTLAARVRKAVRRTSSATSRVRSTSAGMVTEETPTEATTARRTSLCLSHSSSDSSAAVVASSAKSPDSPGSCVPRGRERGVSAPGVAQRGAAFAHCAKMAACARLQARQRARRLHARGGRAVAQALRHGGAQLGVQVVRELRVVGEAVQERGHELADAEAHGLVRRARQRQQAPQQLLQEHVVRLAVRARLALVGEQDDEPDQPLYRRLALRAGVGAAARARVRPRAAHPRTRQRALATTKACSSSDSSSSSSSVGASRRRVASMRTKRSWNCGDADCWHSHRIAGSDIAGVAALRDIAGQRRI
jgi:hypothetical protein